jgi:hypothetical protein
MSEPKEEIELSDEEEDALDRAWADLDFSDAVESDIYDED